MKCKSSMMSVSLVCMLLLLGCGKDKENFVPYELEIPDYTVTDFFEKLQNNLVEESTFYSGDDFYYITPKKSVIQLAKNSLVRTDGSICDCQVKVVVIEAYTKGEILMFGRHTVTSKALLESAGEFKITFTAADNDETLSLKAGKKLKLQVQQQTNQPLDDRMELFYGQGDGAGFTWTESDGDSTTWNTANGEEWALQDSLQGWGFGYECFPEQLTWINVDKFVDIPEDQKTSVCVKLPENYTNKNTAVFMVFKDLNSVVQLSGSADTKLFCEPYGLVPLGYEVTFVVISKQGEEVFHFGSQMTSIRIEHLEEIKPKETAFEDIKDFLEKL